MGGGPYCVILQCAFAWHAEADVSLYATLCASCPEINVLTGSVENNGVFEGLVVV